MEPAETTKRLTPEEIKAKVDEAGVLDELLDRKADELVDLKAELSAEASHQVDGGTAVVLEGNVFKATVPFSATFDGLELEGAETDFDPIDAEQGEKLVPWKGKKAHKDFIGGQDEIKELKAFLDEFEGGGNLFKRLFKHVPDSRKRTANETALGNMARTTAKKHIESGLKAAALKFVKTWTAKSVALAKKK